MSSCELLECRQPIIPNVHDLSQAPTSLHLLTRQAPAMQATKQALPFTSSEKSSKVRHLREPEGEAGRRPPWLHHHRCEVGHYLQLDPSEQCRVLGPELLASRLLFRHGLELDQNLWRDVWPYIADSSLRTSGGSMSVGSCPPTPGYWPASPAESLSVNLCREKQHAWHGLLLKITEIQQTDESDLLIWLLLKSGKFSVKSMYDELLDQDMLPVMQHCWNVKIPLKIKNFLWFLHKEVTLTRDNLVRRNWKGSVKCSLCNCNESINHLLFQCDIAKFIWRIIEISFDLKAPASVSHLFGHWLGGVNLELRRLIMVGAAAILWAIWLSRNEMTFNKVTILSPMQVIYRCTRAHTGPGFWSLLQHKKERRELLKRACIQLEMVTMELSTKNGWRFSNRLEV